MKTVMPIPGPDGTPMVDELTCPCRDVNLTNSDAARRFINAYQSATGLAPGVYAAEAWDAGTLTAQAFHDGVRDRQQMRDYVGSLDSYDGTGGPVRFDDERRTRGPAGLGLHPVGHPLDPLARGRLKPERRRFS